MLLKRATFHNIGPFKHYVFDVEEKRGVVALTAINGTGKTWCLEAGILGAAYRKLETQGTLVGRATDREAWVESELVFREPFTVRQVVDGVSRASETLLLDAEALPILADTKVTTYSAWAARRLPDPDVYLAGPFCVQKSAGFVGMTSSERIAVILRVLGVARLERMAKAAAARAAAAEKAFDLAGERIAATRGSDPGSEAAEAALLAARLDAATAEELLTGAKAALAARQQDVADHGVRKAQREAADRLLTALQDQAKGAAERRADAELRIKGNQQIQADAELIRAAAAGLEAANAELTRLELALVEADKQIAKLLDPWHDALARARAAGQRREAASKRLKDKAAVELAVADLPALTAVVEAALATVEATEVEIRALEAKRWASAEERFGALRAGLGEIENLDADLGLAPVIAHKAIEADDAVIVTATETPAKVKELRVQLNGEKDRAALASRAKADADRLAARAADVANAETDQAAAEREVVEIGQGHALAVLSAVLRALGRREVAVAAKVQATMLEPMRKLAGRLAALDDSDRRLTELEQQLTTATAEEAKTQEQIAAVELVDVGEPPSMAQAQQALNAADASAGTARAAVAKAEAGLARSCEIDAKVVALEADRAAAAAELADWNRLELDLGRKGIQSAEVDSAGPELTALTNDLLHRCHGPRYTVEVKTQRLDAKGKNLVDECTIRVIDSVKGTDKEVSEHSGGECTILAEALSLALTMMGCRRAGFSDFTIVRDESGAALDPMNNRAYVAMLRHAIAVTGARHVLLVSHSPEVQSLCDHIIEIPEAA